MPSDFSPDSGLIRARNVELPTALRAHRVLAFISGQRTHAVFARA